MKRLLFIVLLLQIAPVYGSQRLPLAYRTNAVPVKEASTGSPNHLWKLGLLGLAALSFVIRKRL